MSLNNKVALITGSGSGIGAAIALLFSKEGAVVVIVDINENAAYDTMRKIEEIGKEALVIVTDITNDDEVKNIIKKIIEKYGKLDILINNAGIIKAGAVLDGSVMNTYDQVMNVNVRAIVQMTSQAAPYLVKTKGCVVNISSVAALKAKAAFGCISYCMSKASVHAFTEATALELSSLGVRVNSVAPGAVATGFAENSGIQCTLQDYYPNLTSNKKSFPIEIANFLLYLVSDKALSITGSCFVIDNGMLLM